MKRLIIICEGQTEQEFCNDVLRPYFLSKNIQIDFPKIKETGGGIVAWKVLKNQIEMHLKQEQSATVTTLIDFYGLKENHHYPSWVASKNVANKAERMLALEKAMLNDIETSLQWRFIPYIQLHEFEGLLFSDIDVFKVNFEENEFANFSYLLQTIQQHPNPETINDGKETAPSKRLEKIFKSYNKVNLGSLIAQEIGISKIREKCPRFNHWITQLASV